MSCEVMQSGTLVKTNAEIRTANGCWIDKNTDAIVVGVAHSSNPLVYLCETRDEFEPEEFFCYSENIELLPSHIAENEIKLLEERIASGMTTAADVDLLRRIISQVKTGCRSLEVAPEVEA